MTIFEYLMVLVSIVLALGLTQVLRGFSKLVRAERRYAPVALWGVALFLVHAQVWWELWDTRQVSDWSQLGFLYILLIPCALFAATELLLPSTSSPNIDWRTHFFEVRIWFYGAYFAFHLLATSFTWLLLDVPLTHPYRGAQAAMTSIHLVGMFTTRPAAHVWLAVSYIVVVVVSQAFFRLFPSGL